MFGSLTLGSIIWGKVAALTGLPIAHLVAALGGLLGIPLLWSWKLQTCAGMDLTPSSHWPEPVVVAEHGSDRGPVLVSVEYEIEPQDRAAFLDALNRLAGERCRDGAFQWGVFEDLGRVGRFVETFMLDSWSEHLRQHARVTHADHALQELVNRFQVSGAPQVRHLIAADLA
jgi:Transmembrane secretion effector